MSFAEIKKELIEIAEKKMGMPWDQIMAQAAKDTEAQKKQKDPIAEAYKQSSISPNKMFKSSMNELNRLLEKKV